MGRLNEYSPEDRAALGLLSEEDLTQKERLRDKHADQPLPDYEKLRELEGQ